MNKKQTANQMRRQIIANAPRLADPEQTKYVDAIVKRQMKLKHRAARVAIA